MTLHYSSMCDIPLHVYTVCIHALDIGIHSSDVESHLSFIIHVSDVYIHVHACIYTCTCMYIYMYMHVFFIQPLNRWDLEMLSRLILEDILIHILTIHIDL